MIAVALTVSAVQADTTLALAIVTAVVTVVTAVVTGYQAIALKLHGRQIAQMAAGEPVEGVDADAKPSV